MSKLAGCSTVLVVIFEAKSRTGRRSLLEASRASKKVRQAARVTGPGRHYLGGWWPTEGLRRAAIGGGFGGGLLIWSPQAPKMEP